MRTLVMSVRTIGCTMASRTVSLGQGCAMLAASLRRTAALRLDRSGRTCVTWIMGLRQTVASRTVRLAQAGMLSILTLSPTPRSHAERWTRAWVAPINRLTQVLAFHTRGVHVQVLLAFTLSFVVSMAVGVSVLSLGARTQRAATPAARAEPTAGIPTVPPSVEPRPAEPSVALPSLPEPSKRSEEDARLASASPAGQSQAPSVAVRSNGSVRSEAAKVTDIALWGSPTKPWVSITASAPVRYQLRNVEPDWVVIDISRAQLALTAGRPPAGRGLVRLIRAGQFTPDVVRVVLELTQAVPTHVATSPGKNAIVVSLAADAGGNSRSVPSPRRQPGEAKPVHLAGVVPPVPGT